MFLMSYSQISNILPRISTNISQLLSTPWDQKLFPSLKQTKNFNLNSPSFPRKNKCGFVKLFWLIFKLQFHSDNFTKKIDINFKNHPNNFICSANISQRHFSKIHANHSWENENLHETCVNFWISFSTLFSSRCHFINHQREKRMKNSFRLWKKQFACANIYDPQQVCCIHIFLWKFEAITFQLAVNLQLSWWNWTADGKKNERKNMKSFFVCKSSINGPGMKQPKTFMAITNDRCEWPSCFFKLTWKSSR